MALERRVFTFEGSTVYLWIFYHRSIWVKAQELIVLLGGHANEAQNISKLIFKSHRKSLDAIMRMSPGMSVPLHWHPRSVFLNEAGIYQLANSTSSGHHRRPISLLPNPERFQTWLCDNMLPDIRHVHLLMLRQVIEAVRQQRSGTLRSVRGSYVYLAASPIYKNINMFILGKTRNPNKQLKRIQKSNIEKCFYLHTIPVEDHKAMHQILRCHFHANRSSNGTFLKLSDAEVDRFPEIVDGYERVFFRNDE